MGPNCVTAAFDRRPPTRSRPPEYADPATQMRDLKEFLAAGYTLTAVQPFDLFPQTRHLECVLTLVRGPQPAAGLPNELVLLPPRG